MASKGPDTRVSNQFDSGNDAFDPAGRHFVSQDAHSVDSTPAFRAARTISRARFNDFAKDDEVSIA